VTFYFHLFPLERAWQVKNEQYERQRKQKEGSSDCADGAVQSMASGEEGAQGA